MRDVMTVQEVARALGVSKGTLRKMCNDRKIPYFHVGVHRRFRRAELREWWQQCIEGKMPDELLPEEENA